MNVINVLIYDAHLGEVIEETLRENTEQTLKCWWGNSPEDVKIDIFIIQATTLKAGRRTASRLKKERGHKKSKILAISTIDPTLLKNEKELEAVNLIMDTGRLVGSEDFQDETNKRLTKTTLERVLHSVEHH